MHLLLQIGLVIFLLESSNGALLLGSKRCTWGPSYWCSHLGTMKECRSVSYCARFWQRGPVLTAGSGSVESNGDCGFCRLLASDLERLARANGTSAADNRRLATAACELVPDARQRSLCQAVVDNYLDEAVQLLQEGLSTDRLCGALSLCGNGRRDPKLHVAMATQQQTKPPAKTWRARLAKDQAAAAVSGRLLRGGFCDLCMEFVNIVKLAAGNKAAEAEVVQLIKAGVCARLSDAQSLCNLWVDSYVPEVMRQLANNTDPRQVCTSAQFCQAAAVVKFDRHPLMQLMILQKAGVKPLKDAECQVCEMLVSEARQMLRDNKTQDEIIQFVKDRVCSIIPSEKDKCIRAVTEYAPIIFQLLASELDPNAVCQALGACGKTAAAAAAARTAAAPRRRPRIGPQCILCEYVIRELDQMLGSNRTVAAIESALSTVCAVMPQTIRQECNDWVSQYTPAVLQLLSQDLSPALVCTVLGLCTGDSSAAPKLAASGKSTTTTCDVCQTVILYVKSLLKDNATEQEVMNVLEKVCNFLPSQEQPTCRTFIEQYTPYIIQLLLDDTDPKQVCQTIGLCPNAAASGSLRYRSDAGVVQMKNRPADSGPIV